MSTAASKDSKSKTKKPRVKKAKKEVYVDPQALPGDTRVSKRKLKLPKVNLDDLYALVGCLSGQVERDLKAFEGLRQGMAISREKMLMEMHLLSVHIQRVVRELQVLRDTERNIQAHSRGILNGAQSVVEDFLPLFEKAPEVYDPLEELSASLQREAGVMGDPRHTELLLDELQRVARLRVDPPQPSQLGVSAASDAFSVAKKASLEVLVDMESKLAQRFTRS
jgi:hypothetical protein